MLNRFAHLAQREPLHWTACMTCRIRLFNHGIHVAKAWVRIVYGRIINAADDEDAPLQMNGASCIASRTTLRPRKSF